MLLLDDTVHVSAAHVTQLYEVWKHFPNNMIGFEPQSAPDNKGGRVKYVSVPSNTAMVHRHLLHVFACNGPDAHMNKKLHSRLLAMADEIRDCDGLALAAIAPHNKGAVPMYVQPLATERLGTCTSGLRRYVDTSVEVLSRKTSFANCYAKIVAMNLAYTVPSRFTYVRAETTIGSSSSTGGEWKVRLHKEMYMDYVSDPFESCVRDDSQISAATTPVAVAVLVPVFEGPN